MEKGLTLSLRWLSAAWVVQAVPWSFSWLAKAGPSGLWSILWGGEFHWIVAGHVLLGVSSALAPVLLLWRREVAALFVLIVAAVSCLCLVGLIFSPDMLSSGEGWLRLLLPRVALSFLTLAVVFLHAVARARTANGEPARR